MLPLLKLFLEVNAFGTIQIDILALLTVVSYIYSKSKIVMLHCTNNVNPRFGVFCTFSWSLCYSQNLNANRPWSIRCCLFDYSISFALLCIIQI